MDTYSAIMALATIGDNDRYKQVMAARKLIGQQDHMIYADTIRPVLIDGCSMVKGVVTMKLSVGDDGDSFWPVHMDLPTFCRMVDEA